MTKNRVIIVGGGELGKKIARMLLREGKEVVIVEKDHIVCEKLVIELPEAHIELGDVTNPKTLRRVGLENAEAFIAATGEDAINIVSALVAARHGLKNIIVKVKDETHKQICKELGLTNIVDPAESAARRVVAMLKNKVIIDIENILEREFEIKEVKIGSEHNGITIEEFMKKINNEEEYPIFVIRNGKWYLPRLSLKLKNNDVIILLKKKRKGILL